MEDQAPLPEQTTTLYQPTQVELPNATAILVLGILSIVFACCYGIVGLGMAIAALIMGKSALRTYRADPGRYTAGSLSNVSAGRTCAIIGLVISGLFVLALLIYIVFYVLILGVAFSGALMGL